MFIRVLLSIFFLFTFSTFSSATPIQLDFEISVKQRGNIGPKQTSNDFIPFSAISSINFNSEIIRRAPYSSDLGDFRFSYLDKSTLEINSPDTAWLHQSPFGTPWYSNTAYLASWINSTTQGSTQYYRENFALQTLASRDNDKNQSWIYSIQFAIGFAEILNGQSLRYFDQQSVEEYIERIIEEDRTFQFTEMSFVIDMNTRDYLSGFLYTGSARIINYTVGIEQPPATFLFGLGCFIFLLFRISKDKSRYFMPEPPAETPH